MFENSANGDGPRSGRELEIAELLPWDEVGRRKERGVVDRGHPLHRGALLRSAQGAIHGVRSVLGVHVGAAECGHVRAEPLDNTFGPEVKFFKAPPKGQSSLPPSAGCSSSEKWKLKRRRG